MSEQTEPLTVATTVTTVSKPPRGITRRGFLKRAALWGGLPALGGFYATQIEPFWTQHHEQSVSVPSLPPAFDGCRITQLTDLHAGRVPWAYLERVFHRVRANKPEYLVVTGDLTHHDPDAVDRVASLIGSIGVPTFVTLGNHDYGVYRGNDDPGDIGLADRTEAACTAAGCVVLRNASHPIDRVGQDGVAQRLWVVGMDDLWFGNFNPPLAFGTIPRGTPALVLSHNPDTAERIDWHKPGLTLAGHTHGGQVRIPGYGAPYLNTADREYDEGLFRLRNSHLYVSRGVGYIRRLRFDCRPEVPTFVLRRA